MNRTNTRQKYNINIHIEELVLDGFPVSDQNRITAALQQELHRLLGQGELPVMLTRDGSVVRLDGGTVRLESGATPETMGKQVAQSLYGGLQR